MSPRLLNALRATFLLLVAAEVAYVFLWPEPAIWPGVVIVSLAFVLGLVLLLNS